MHLGVRISCRPSPGYHVRHAERYALAVTLYEMATGNQQHARYSLPSRGTRRLRSNYWHGIKSPVRRIGKASPICDKTSRRPIGSI